MSLTTVAGKLWQSLFCTMEGMAAVWRQEQSFRLEIMGCALLLPFLLMMSARPVEKMALILLMLLLLVVELINSAIEALVDRISLDIHPLSRYAKDASCAAVALVILMNITAWLWVIL